MEIKNGALGYTLTLDNKQVQQILAQTRADFARTNEYAINEMNKVQSKMSSIAVLGGSFLSISAAKGFVTELIHVRGEFQQIENAIETITGSQDKMNSLMTEWKDLTLRSPFRLSEIAQSGKQLLAYGVEVEKVTDDIEMLGNIASGVSAPINDIAYLYGTLKTQGRAYQQDINQFTGRGIPIIKELAKQFGVAESEIRSMTEAGKIGFPEVEKALRSMTSEGGQFYNLIGKQATTLTGAVNRLKHEFELMFNEIGTDTEGLLSGGINVVTHLVENYQTLGKTLGVLITTYGAYKAALMTVSILQKIVASSSAATMYLEMSRELGILTLGHKARAVAIGVETAAQKALNTVMMANPYALILAGVVALGTAYYFLSDNTTSAQRAQEAYNKTQEEVKSKLDETKKKADEYINTLKDETATVYQQIQAYNALQALKLKGLENLTQEQIATMDLTELRKLLNASYDEKGLDSQKKYLSEIGEKIDLAKKKLESYNKIQSDGVQGLEGKIKDTEKTLDSLNKEYEKQLNNVNKIERELKISNMTLSEQKSYYEGIVQELQNKVNEIRKANEQQKQTETAADLVASAFAKWDISKLNFQLNDAYGKIYEINDQINKTGPVIKNQPYWEDELKKAREDFGKALPGTEKYIEAKKRIDEANNALKAWETTKTKAAKKTKTPKKSDDPVEIFKKQVQGMKDEYDRYVNYMNSDDIVLKATAEAISLRIKNKGANYEEYLRNIQKQLANVTNKTKAQVGQLQYVNDELQKVLSYNAFDKYKEGINEQVDSSDKLLDVIEKVQQEKQKFANSTDQIEKDKFKFLDEKEIELMKKANDEARNLLDTLSKEANPLQAIKDSFDNQLFLLKKTILDAQNEINKLTDQNNTLKPSDPNKEDTRVKNEQTILKLKGEQLKAQNLIDYNEKKRENAIKKTPTDNADYNQLLEQYQDFETKKKNIASEYEDKLTTVRDERIELQNNKELQANQTLLDQMLAQNTAVENELEKQKKDAISKITLEQFKNSDLYMKMILGDLDKMSSQTMQDIINGFDEALRNPEIGGKMNLTEFKVVEDRVKEMKERLSQNGFNPFQALQNNFAIFKENFKKGFTEIDRKLDFENIGGMIQGLKGGLNESINLVEGLGINVSDTTKDSIKLGLELFEAGSQIAQGIVSGNPQDILAGLYKGASAIINARKKARESEKKAQEELKKYQDEIFSSQLEYNKLLRERYLTEARINDLYVSRIQNIHEEKDALSKSLKSVVQDQQNIFNRLLNAETITGKSTKKKGGFLGIGRKTVVVEHTSTVAQLLGLQQGAQLTDEIFEKLQRLNAEKPLTGDAKDAYEQLKKVRDEYGSIDDAMKDLEIKLKDALTGTTAQNIADSIIDGLKSGKSSFQDFAEDVEGFLRNAIISGMSAKIIEPEMQKLQDALADMMGDGVLTDEEKKKWQEMYAKVAKDAQNYFDVMDQAGIGLSSSSNPNQKSLSGAIKGMSEQEANIISGNINAVRIMIAEANKQRDLSNKILLQQLDRLANIDANTRVIEPLLNKLINKIDNAGRAYGF